MIMLQMRVATPHPMHAERLCKRYMQTATVINFAHAKQRLIARRQREAEALRKAAENEHL